MICEHLIELERAIKSAGFSESYRGQPWSQNCREWVYFECVLDLGRIGKLFEFSPYVKVHKNDDPKSGRESGLVCDACKDGIMGIHAQDGRDKPIFPDGDATNQEFDG